MSLIEQFKRQLEQTEEKPELEEIGQVLEVKDRVVRATGLEKVGNFELVKFEAASDKNADIFGLVLNLEEAETGIVVLGDDQQIKEGDTVKRTKKTLSAPVGEKLVGRVIDPLGRPLDEKGEIESENLSPIEEKAPSVIERQPVKEPLQTGVLGIDALVPIGRGQRELILGDRSIGKTALAIDAILNQKEEENRPICI